MRLQLNRPVFDSWDFDPAKQGKNAEHLIPGMVTQEWDGGRVDQSFATRGTNVTSYQGFGFYGREHWGCWSQKPDPLIVLSFALTGDVKLSLLTIALGGNIGRTVFLHVGGQEFPFTLTETPHTHVFRMELPKPTNVLSFSGLDARRLPELEDHRTMAMGLVSLRVQRPGSPLKHLWRRRPRVTPTREKTAAIDVEGVVYTAVFDPWDGRANLADLVSAFCFTHGDRDDATLILVAEHPSPQAFLEHVMSYYAPVGSRKCRILAVAGRPDSVPGQGLLDATTYYVNSSRIEEEPGAMQKFMRAGIPVVTPAHNALTDQVGEDTGFIVKSSVEPTPWPEGLDAPIDKLWLRFSWESLVEQFRESYRVGKHEPARYNRMSASAAACSFAPVPAGVGSGL